MVEKKNPDYSASAVKLCNPPEVYAKLAELHIAQHEADQLDAVLKALPDYEALKAAEQKAADITAQIRGMVDTLGSFQDIELGEYAIKQRRESITYKAELARQSLESKALNMVLIESVNTKALDGLVKGGIVTPEQARQCGEIKESFAYIIK